MAIKRKVTTEIPNLIGGVSQQPENLRFDNQCEEQINFDSSIIEGLTKRPPARFIKELSGLTSLGDKDFIGVINRSPSQQYFLVVKATSGTATTNEVKIFDLSGNPVTINSTVWSYLSTENPSKDVKILTVADTTFVLNRGISGAFTTNKSTEWGEKAIVWVKQAVHNVDYTVSLNGNKYSARCTSASDVSSSLLNLCIILGADVGGGSHTVYSADSTAGGLGSDPELVVASDTLNGGINASDTTIALNSTSGFTSGGGFVKIGTEIIEFTGISANNLTGCTRGVWQSTAATHSNGAVVEEMGINLVDGMMHLTKVGAGQFSDLYVTDSYSKQGYGIIYKKVPNLSELPAEGFNGFNVQVVGDSEIEQDDFYVTFETATGDDFGDGSWVETIASQAEQTIDGTYMPHKLVYSESTSDYTLDEITWDNRLVGDDDTNPFPSVVELTGGSFPVLSESIQDIFFFKDRFGILTKTNIIFSGVGDYFNLFRTSVTASLDSDRIDIGLAHSKASDFQVAEPFESGLFVSNYTNQFHITGSPLLTSETVKQDVIGSYEISGTQRLSLEGFLYLPFFRGEFNGINEFLKSSITDKFTADEITQHVPKYIPKNTEGIKQLAGSSAEKIVVCSVENSSYLFVYRYFRKEGQETNKLQASWSKIDFPERTVRGFFFVESDMYLVTQKVGKNPVRLEKLSWEAGQNITGKTYDLRLDSRMGNDEFSSITYSAASKVTTFSGCPINTENLVVYTEDGILYPTTPTGATDELNGAITDSDGTITLADASLFASSGEIKINNEWISYSGKSSNDLTGCVRGLYGSTAAAHSSGDSVQEYTGDFTVIGDISSETVYVGFDYASEYTFTRPTFKIKSGSGKSPSRFIKQIVKRGSVQFNDTGHFKVIISKTNRDDENSSFNGVILGSNFTVGEMPLADGFHTFLVKTPPEDCVLKLYSDKAKPCNFLNAEFENNVREISPRFS